MKGALKKGGLDLISIYHTRPFAFYFMIVLEKKILVIAFSFFLLSFKSVRILMRKGKKLFKQEMTEIN